MTDTGEKVLYYEYVGGDEEFLVFEGTVRLIPGGENVNVRHSKRHLRIDDEDAPNGWRNVNNVLNIENYGLNEHRTNSFWVHARESQL